MELMFEVISRQKFSTGFSVSHVFSEAGGVIGRSEACEWILPDRGKRISRKHALISCDGRCFFIEDVSQNGIFTEPGRLALEKEVQHKIEHGDSFTIGVYTIQARLLHRPDAYIQPRVDEDWLVEDDSALSADPLVAMEQQEQFEARRRLGLYDDLLGEVEPDTMTAPPDHNSAGTDSLSRVLMVRPPGEDASWEDRAPDDEPFLRTEAAGEDRFRPPVQTSCGCGMGQEGAAPEVDIFFRALGFSRVPDSAEERERLLRQAAEIIVASVDGLHHCLRNQAECKNDLRLPAATMSLSGNNPLMFTPTPAVALERLLAPAQEGMLPAGQAVLSGFNDLHGHHLGLLAGARAAVRAVLDKISPAAVEARLDTGGRVRLSRHSRVWHLFRKMHQSLLDDHEGFAALFLHDFARAYDAQVRILSPLPGKPVSKGDT